MREREEVCAGCFLVVAQGDRDAFQKGKKWFHSQSCLVRRENHEHQKGEKETTHLKTVGDWGDECT